MKSLPELVKEKMLIRSTSPIRADVIGLLVNDAKAIAKTESREVVEKDLVQVAKSLKKKLEKLLLELPSDSPLYARTQSELKELKTFIPATRDRAETDLLLRGAISTLPLTEQKNRKAIMALIKDHENLDMALVNQELTNILKEGT